MLTEQILLNDIIHMMKLETRNNVIYKNNTISFVLPNNKIITITTKKI